MILNVLSQYEYYSDLQPSSNTGNKEAVWLKASPFKPWVCVSIHTTVTIVNVLKTEKNATKHHTSTPLLLQFESSKVAAVNRVVLVNKSVKSSSATLSQQHTGRGGFYQASLWQWQQAALKLVAQRGRQRGKHYYTLPAVSEHQEYQCRGCCADRCTHRAECYLHGQLCHRPSKVWSVCRVQCFLLLTVVLALASGEKRAAWLSQQSQQFTGLSARKRSTRGEN